MSYTLLFDIGKVIVDFDFRISVRKIADRCTSDPKDIIPCVNELKDDLETGNLSPDQFLDLAIEKTGYSGDRDFLTNAFQDVFELNLPMVDLIEAESKKGTPLYLLSNTNGLHVPFLFENYPVFELFDGAAYSHELFCMKPNPQIYLKTISLFQLAPKKTVYIDDLRENCEAGTEKGFHSIQYEIGAHKEFLTEFEAAKKNILG